MSNLDFFKFFGNVVILALFYIWHLNRKRMALNEINKWIIENNYEIVSMEFRLLFKGPFKKGVLTTIVYKLLIKDSDGFPRSCWVRVWGKVSQLIYKEYLDVEWDLGEI